MVTRIEIIEDVKTFIKQLVNEGLNYHPDEDFTQYVNIHTEEPTYSEEEAAVRNALNCQCFEVCEASSMDIYDTAQEIFLIVTGMDKYIPPPSTVNDYQTFL